jgi:hypothetical protein
MSDPHGYPPVFKPSTDFASVPVFQKSALDVEFLGLAVTLRHIRALLMAVVRDDWGLRDGLVTLRVLAEEVRLGMGDPTALLAATDAAEGAAASANQKAHEAEVSALSAAASADSAAASAAQNDQAIQDLDDRVTALEQTSGGGAINPDDYVTKDDLKNSNETFNKGAGLVGYNDTLTYDPGTIGFRVGKLSEAVGFSAKNTVRVVVASGNYVVNSEDAYDTLIIANGAIVVLPHLPDLPMGVAVAFARNASGSSQFSTGSNVSLSGKRQKLESAASVIKLTGLGVVPTVWQVLGDLT